MDPHLTPLYSHGNLRHASPTPNKSRSYRGLIHPAPNVNPKNIHGNNDANSLKAYASPNRSMPKVINSFGNTDVQSYDSGIGAMTQSIQLQRVCSPMRQVAENSRTAQLPVRHTSLKGTQEGILFPKYFSDVSSKCIMCKACGIFFSHNVFLSHLHDIYGKRVECQGQRLELAIDVPKRDQIMTYEEFLIKLGKNNESGYMMQSYQQSGSPIQNMQSQIVPKPRSPLVNKWSQDIQETVRASEKLLKETSEYLRTSATKMKHRRKNSLQLQELPFTTKGDVVIPSPTAEERNGTMPIIKTQNSHRSSRKSLQNYFKSSQYDTKESNLQLPMPVTMTQQVVASKLSKNHTHVESNLQLPLPVTTTHQFVPSKLPNNHTDTPSEKDNFIDLTSHHGARLTESLDLKPHASGHLKSFLHEESHNPKPSASEESVGVGFQPSAGSLGVGSQPSAGGDAPPSGSWKVNSGATAAKGVPVQKGLRPTQDKNDPIYILQTAQDLITLATQKIQQKPQHSQDSEWFSKYQAEHTLRLKCEANIAELQGLLHEEQKQRQELEIQLRALRLQNL